jgi:NADP-dependent 3-hydroxy acid dehydrogenase YdfG
MAQSTQVHAGQRVMLTTDASSGIGEATAGASRASPALRSYERVELRLEFARVQREHRALRVRDDRDFRDPDVDRTS